MSSALSPPSTWARSSATARGCRSRSARSSRRTATGTAPVAAAALAGGADVAGGRGGRRGARPCAREGIEAPDPRDGRASRADELRAAIDADADVVAWTEEVAEAAPRVHVKLDTGMGRLGTKDRELALRLAAPRQRRRADDPLRHRRRPRRRPVRRPARGLPRVRARRSAASDLIAHAANSAAALRDPASHFDMVRCGVAIYGMDPFGEDPAAHGLEPALSLRSWVAAVRRFEAGDSAGYGRRWTAPEPTWVATVPIGYGDGWRRALTNNCDVLIRGRRHPLAGTVSMDNVTVALGPDTRRGGGGRGGADRRAGRGAHTGRGGGAPARHDQLRGHLRAHAAGAPPARAVTDAWIVGGALRDELLGRPVRDVDVAVAGDPARAARALAAERARAGVPAVGGVRRLARDRPRRAAGCRTSRRCRARRSRQDLRRRDFTVNAMARPVRPGRARRSRRRGGR